MIDVIGVVFFPSLCYGGFLDVANITIFLNFLASTATVRDTVYKLNH